MKSYMLIPHINIHNANAISSSYTIGIPAMTAWLGFMHAIERKLKVNESLQGFVCNGLALSVHNYHIHSYDLKENAYKSIAITGNPLKKKGKNFERPSFVAEGRIDIEVSLLIEVIGVNGDNESKLCEALTGITHTMKIAGGDIVAAGKPEIAYFKDVEEAKVRRLIHRLMPGHILIERRDLLVESAEEDDDLDMLLNFLQITCTAEKSAEGEVLGWNYARKLPGWLVPVAVGYRGIAPVGRVGNQRDSSCEHQFVEPLVTMGEFKPAYRMTSIDDMMWRYEVKDNLYLCVNQKL